MKSTDILNSAISVDMPFPLFEINESVTTSLNGDLAYHYKLIPPDLEQMTDVELLSFYEGVKGFINTTNIKYWYKFYKISNDIFVSTNDSELQIPKIKIVPCEDLLNSFFPDDLLMSDINFYTNYLTIGSEYWKLIYVENLMPSLFEDAISSFDEDFIITFKRIGSDVAKRTLSQARNKQSVALNTNHENHEGSAAYTSVDNMLRNISVGGDSLHDVGLWYVVKADSLTILNEKCKTLFRSLKQQGAKVFMEEGLLSYYFNSLIPGVLPVKNKTLKCNSEDLSLLLPLSKSVLHDSGMKLYDLDWTEVYYDFLYSKNSNLNTLVTGQSGEGKSFFVGGLIQHLRTHHDVNLGIFDLGGSLKRVAMYNGGVNLTKRFNPFQFKDSDYLLSFFLATIGEEISKKDKGKLHFAIKDCLDKEISKFKDFVFEVGKEFDGIEYYFSEVWDYIVDDIIEPPNVFYIDVEGMPDNVIAPYFVFAKKLSESREGLILDVFDEVWNIISKCPDVLTTKVRTGRKNLRANLLVTQELDSFTEEHSAVAPAVLGNTYTKIYFFQPSLNHSSFSDYDKSRIFNDVKSSKGSYSTLYINTPDTKKVCHFVADNFTYELCHTEKEDKDKQDVFINKNLAFMNYKDSFHKWIRSKYV